MKRVLTAVVLIPLVLLVVFKAPLWLFAFVVGVIVLLCLHEYLGIVERYGIEPTRWATYLVSILLVVGTFIFIAAQYDAGPRGYAKYLWVSQHLHWAILVLTPLIFGIPVVFRRDLRMALGASAASAFGVLYIALPLAFLISMRWTPGHSILAVFVLLSVWAGDIAAYYVGRSLGRHKLAPVVSPGKTWEGAIASLAASVLTAAVVFHFLHPINHWFASLPSYWPVPNPEDASGDLHLYVSGPPNRLLIYVLGVIANIAAQFGDLFESAIKRGAQIKDSGSLLPGHGGILDRIDALLFAIPAVWYYAVLTQFLQWSATY
jgi:phosphatidate cytidylyltransferase